MIGAPQYLPTLYIAEWEGDEESPISPGYVTGALNHSPPAVTEHLQNLDAKGLVDYESYEGATLTAEGRDAAADPYDTYQILSRLCRDVLDVNDHEDEVMQLVGNASPTVAERPLVTLFRDGGDCDEVRQAAGSEPTSSPDNLASRTHRCKSERSLMLINKWH